MGERGGGQSGRPPRLAARGQKEVRAGQQGWRGGAGLVGRSLGRSVGRLVGRSLGRSVGRLVGRSLGRSVGRLGWKRCVPGCLFGAGW